MQSTQQRRVNRTEFFFFLKETTFYLRHALIQLSIGTLFVRPQIRNEMKLKKKCKSIVPGRKKKCVECIIELGHDDFA